MHRPVFLTRLGNLHSIDGLQDILLSIAIVTKTHRGDLVLVGREMDPKLAGLYGPAASANDETISDVTSVTYLFEWGEEMEDVGGPL